jgi:isopentenyl phosphate kinase
MKATILKLGGSLITEKAKDEPMVRTDVLKRLAEEISKELKEKELKLIIVHGAGPYGHVLAKEYGRKEGIKGLKQRMGDALTHQSMEELNKNGRINSERLQRRCSFFR